MSTVLGTVTALRRYPVKSMRGESLPEAALGPSGFDGDRAWALLDPLRNWASAKTNRGRWRLVDGMLDLQATTVAGPPPSARDGGDDADRPSAASDGDEDDPRVQGHGEPDHVTIALPDGRTVIAGTPDADRVLSEHLGRELRFDLGDRGYGWGRHYDDSPVHLVTTATLAALPGDDGSPLDPHRLRPNLVVSTPPEAPDFAEDRWLGHAVRVGTAVLRVTERTERCVMTTRAQADEVVHAPTVLKRIGRANQACAGVYLTVVTPGIVAVGDELTLA